MNRFGYATLIFVLLLSVAVVFSACKGNNADGSREAPSPPTNAQGVGEGSEATPEPVRDITQEARKIVFYTPVAFPQTQFDQRYGDIVKKKFPNYTIEFLDLQSGGTPAEMIARGTQFDILFTTAGFLENVIFQHGFAQELNDLLKEHNVDISKYDPAFRPVLGEAFDGKIYFLPVHADNVVLFYNKEVFDRFNVPYPKDGITWREMREMSKRLSQTVDGISYIGYNPAPLRYFRMNQFAIPMINPNTLAPTINTDDRWNDFFRSYAEEYKATINDSREVFTLNSGDQNNLFFGGKQAMLLSLPFIMFTRQDQFNQINFGVASAPVLDEYPSNGFAPYPLSFTVSSVSKNKDAAMEILKFLISDEAQRFLARSGFGPVINNIDVQNSLGVDSGPYANYNWQAVFHTPFAPFTFYGPYVVELQNIYQAYFAKVINDEIDVNTARRMAEEEAIRKIDEMKDTIRIGGR